MCERKKNILIISDRSHYFPFLGSRLEVTHNVFYIAVRKKDEDILRRKGKIFTAYEQLTNTKSEGMAFIDREESEKTLIFEIRKDEIYNNGLKRDAIIEHGINYSTNIARIIETNDIDLVVTQNDSVGHSAIAIAVCRKLNIKTAIFEDGLFRPDTIVFDNKGVNINNSCPTEPSFYEAISPDMPKFEEFVQKEKAKAGTSRANILPLLRYIFSTARHPRKFLNWHSEIRILIDEWMHKNGKLDNYIFLPLQVRTDSQILCHSSFKDMVEVTNTCLTALENYNKRSHKPLALVIKEHPRDAHLAELIKKTNKSSVKIHFLRQADTKQLIANSRMVITVNSTVGIDGLLYHKPVITLGLAFYSIEGIADKGDNCGRLDLLIEKAIKQRIRGELVDKFLFYLKFQYLTDGYLDNPDQESIKPVLARIKTILEEK